MFPKNSKSDALKEIISYTYPKLYTGKEWYVGFLAYDPALGCMRRKKIKVNHIEKITERRKFSAGLIYRLTRKLEDGWNPWIESENANSYRTFTEVLDGYRAYLIKLTNDDNLRLPTMRSYMSRVNMVEKWNKSQKIPITYIYQFDRLFVTEFLNYIYLELNNTVCTHNHYLIWLGTFSNYLVQKMYLKVKPTDGMQTIRKNKTEKNRDVIPDSEIIRLRDHLNKVNKHYLLACYLLYYTLIRPKEMSLLQIKDIHLQKQTIFVSGEISKNRKSAIVTLPAKVIHLMLDLKIFDHSESCYLFSKNFEPGMDYKVPKYFGDYWVKHICKSLNFPSNYKFYSLKDTGITKMLHSCDVLSVRDQARHSDLSITNIYAAKDDKNANARLTNYDGLL